MNLIYLLSIFALLTNLYFLNKTGKKINGVTWFIYTIDLYLCYNIFLVFLLSTVHIPSNFYSLSAVNLLLSFSIYRLNYKKSEKIAKNIQKYYYNKHEIVFFIAISIVCLVIGIVRFNGFSDVVYETTDPNLHYKIAETFSKSNFLLNDQNSVTEMYKTFSHSMSGTYINEGLLMRVFNFIPAYKIHMIFDVLCLILYSLTFYVTAIQLKIGKKKDTLIFFITILYTVGYPLNNMIFGFSYLGFGVFIINLILLSFVLLNDYKDNMNQNKIMMFLLFLLNYSLFFTYYLFVPAVYLSIGIYFLYCWINKKNSFWNTIIYCIVSLVIPFIIGFIYFILPGFFDSSKVSSSSALAMEGYIYRDLFSNFILLFPILIYYFINTIKNKKISIDFIMTIVLVLFTVFIFILGMKGKASSYYYYKLYYVLWLMAWFSIAKVIGYSKKEESTYIWSWFLSLVFVIGVAGFKIESRIQSININFSPTIVSNSITNIYVWNFNRVIEEKPILNKAQIELIQETKKNSGECISNFEIPMTGDYMKKLWFYSLTDIVPIYNHTQYELSQFYENKFDYLIWEKDTNSFCLLYFNGDQYDIDKNNYDLLFENEAGFLIKKKGEA